MWDRRNVENVHPADHFTAGTIKGRISIALMLLLAKCSICPRIPGLTAATTGNGAGHCRATPAPTRPPRMANSNSPELPGNEICF
jgi:hypothetical protein